MYDLEVFIIKQKRLILAFVLVSVLILSSCSPRPKAEDTVKRFLDHMNAYNAESCIELLAPDLANQTKASMSFGGMLSNTLTGFSVDSNSMIALLPMLTNILNMAGFEIDLPKWRGENFKSEESGNVAKITCDMYVISGDEVEKYIAVFDLVFLDGKWLISSMQ